MPRTRDEAARRRVLDAAFDLASQQGAARVTVDEIAAKAGVGKQTIYRWWPSRGDVVLEGLLERTLELTPFPDSGDARTDFRDHLRSVAALFCSPAGSVIRDVVAAAQHDPEVRHGLVDRFWGPRRELSRARIDRAVAEGQLPEGIDREVALDALYGVLWVRLLVGHDRIDAAVADAAVQAVWAGIGSGVA